MSELTQEQFEQLPDFVKNDYQEVDGVYKHAGLLKVKGTADKLNAELSAERKERESLSSRISEFEKEKQAEFEKALEEALEEARSKGDANAIEERYRQQMADREKRVSETLKERDERIEKLTGTLKSRERSLLAGKLANEMATDVGRDLFGEVVQSRIDVDTETGEPIFLNADGSASSLDLDGFMKELQSDSRLKPLLKGGVVTQGGGNANGSNGTGSASFSKGNMGGSREERKAAIAKRFNL